MKITKFFFRLLIASVFTLLATGTKAQIITTIAGNGALAFGGDGGQATAASFDSPDGVAVDGSGNVYIADAGNNRIRKISIAGIVSTFAGDGTAAFGGDGGQASAAQLNSPTGITVDGSGNVYIADCNNNRVRKVSTSGIIRTFAGNGTAAFGGDGGQATSAKLSGPQSVVVDGSGNVYIGDVNNGRIRKVSTAGIIRTFAGNGSSGFSGDGGQATAAELNAPAGVAIDGSGNLYIADQYNFRIRKVNTGGIITTFTTILEIPTGVAVDGSGNVYIVDQTDNLIDKANLAGIVSTFAGGGTSIIGDGGPATAATLRSPYGVAVDGCDNVYIGDSYDNRVRKVSIPTPTLTSTLYPPTVCDTISFSYTPHSTVPSTTFAWSRAAVAGISNPPASGTGNPHELLADTSGVPVVVTYTYILSAPAGCPNTQFVTVTVDPLPASGTITGAAYVCQGAVANIADDTPGGIWSSSDNTVATVDGAGLVAGVAAGTDVIVYTFTNACGSAQTLYPITVYATGDCPEAVSVTTGTTTTVSIYPNPNGGDFTMLISSPVNVQATITITNITGKEVRHFNTETNKPSGIKLPAGVAGIYFISVVANGNKYVGRIAVAGK